MNIIQHKTLFEIIREKVQLGSPNSRGWYELRCAVCHDHSPRCGFFHDGTYTSVHCWNCGIKAKYEEGSGRLSRNFRRILEAFGVTREDLLSLRSGIFAQARSNHEVVTLENLKKVKLVTPTVQLPEQSLPLGHPDHIELQEPLIDYLRSRAIDPFKIQAHFSLSPRFERRVIIPFFRDGKIIYWQARHIDKNVKPRYLNSSVPRDAVLYGYDELYSGSSLPLFVTEGIFDAISLNGVGLLGSSLNESKIELLRRTKRRIIFVIDRDKTGGSLGRSVIEHNWEFSFVDPRVKDPNESVVRFGVLYTIYYLLKSATKTAPNALSTIQLSLGILEGKLRKGP